MKSGKLSPLQVILMVMLVLGGMGRFPGAFLGAFITTSLSEAMRPLEEYRLVLFGAAVVLFILIMPNGIVGLFVAAQKSFLPGLQLKETRHKP